MSLDPIDLRLLALLQGDASLSNAELAERVGLSASQCSRRRSGLEEAGYIRAYRADLDARKLGFGIEAFTRVTLSKHSDATAEDFAQFLEGLDEVQQAHTVAGDADYLLHLRARSLDELGEFVLEAPAAASARAPGALRHRAQDHQGEPRLPRRRRGSGETQTRPIAMQGVLIGSVRSKYTQARFDQVAHSICVDRPEAERAGLQVCCLVYIGNAVPTKRFTAFDPEADSHSCENALIFHG